MPWKFRARGEVGDVPFATCVRTGIVVRGDERTRKVLSAAAKEIRRMDAQDRGDGAHDRAPSPAGAGCKAPLFTIRNAVAVRAAEMLGVPCGSGSGRCAERCLRRGYWCCFRRVEGDLDPVMRA